MAIGQPDRNTMLLSLLSQQRGGLTGRRGRLPHSRYSRPNPMVSPEMSDADITGIMPSSPQRPEMLEQNASESAGVAPAPTGQGVGIGALSPLTNPFAMSVIANMMGVPLPPTTPIALYNVVRKAMSMEEDDALTDPSDVIGAIENPETYSEFSTQDIGLDPDVNPEAFSEFSTEDLGKSAGSIGGGNVGGSASPGGFGGPLGGGGQEGDAGASNTGTVGTGEAGDGK